MAMADLSLFPGLKGFFLLGILISVNFQHWQVPPPSAVNGRMLRHYCTIQAVSLGCFTPEFAFDFSRFALGHRKTSWSSPWEARSKIC